MGIIINNNNKWVVANFIAVKGVNTNHQKTFQNAPVLLERPLVAINVHSNSEHYLSRWGD